MKKLKLILPAMALAAVTFVACNGSKNKNATDSVSTSTTSTTTDSIRSTAKDTTKNAMNADSGDTKFANKAAVGGMAEVALGKLALQKTSSAKIKEFANMMVTDHSKANDELMGIAKNKNMNLPATVDAEHQHKMDSLSNLSGKQFDKAYVSAMVEGHQKTLDLMQTEASNGKDADLKAFAAKTAPVVKAHLDAITKINESMKK
jgi:putative membrane protein